MDTGSRSLIPLAERIRPKNLEELIGHENVLGPQSNLGALLRKGLVPSFILWGPPGTGKTTIAMALSSEHKFHFENIVATEAGVKDLRQIGEKARERRLISGQGTLLFVDEIHRFNKSQQDVLLPYIEKGDFVLIGATTESPSYELNRALLSRCRVVVLERLKKSDLEKIFEKAESYYGIAFSEVAEPEVKEVVLDLSDGDARKLLNNLEILYSQFDLQNKQIKSSEVGGLLQQKTLLYDKNSQYHYDIISAFIKSVRGSDPDAALYYLVRMIEGGEDPVFIARRLVVLASEDIGNADPRALSLAMAASQAVEFIGLPEGEIPLAQATTYLACAPKSNATYKALSQARELVRRFGSVPVPSALRSSGASSEYLYPHDFPKGNVDQQYLPREVEIQEPIYQPKEIGFEKNLKQYLTWLRSK